MNYGLNHLENYLISDLPDIIDKHLLANDDDLKYFYDRRFNTSELLEFIADNYDFKIMRTQYCQNELIKSAYAYLKKKEIYRDELK